MCRTSPLASGPFLQRNFVVVYDSVVRFWPPSTPLLSIAPLRDCWFAVGALAPQEGSLQQRSLQSVRIGFSFARYFSFARSAEISVSLWSSSPVSRTAVSCDRASYSDAPFLHASCSNGRPHGFELCCAQSFFR